jgi:stearoyl-CoA desaturase (delta-9 desaturase)
MWVSAHRKHHRYSDQDNDPHSPRDGAWWSHVLWMLPREGSQHWAHLYGTYAPDLMRDPSLRLLDRTFLWWHLALGTALFLIGWQIWDVETGISLVLWGMALRLVYMLHVTWAVNSASHMWGYRNYATRDNSRNLWWVGLLAFGEGWHNNHHAFPRSAQHGHRWWEVDTTYWIIVLMERTGLAWNVVHNTATIDGAVSLDFPGDDETPLPGAELASDQLPGDPTPDLLLPESLLPDTLVPSGPLPVAPLAVAPLPVVE